MPNCFQLTSKETGQPKKLAELDNEIRAHFGAPPHPTQWYKGWYDCIGFSIAMGKDWQYCRETFDGLDEIIDYLEERYTYDAWFEHKSR